ncbi:MAG: hypothetical protein ACYDCL_19320 [Myxococcales bacterium]
MTHRHFYRDEARARTAKAVAEIEARSAAQLVVALRPFADRHRDADYLFGFVAALAALTGLVYSPIDFSLHAVVIDAVLAFALGAATCAHVDFLRRALTSRRARREATHRAACAAFLDHGVGQTRARLGVLVFVAMFERRVEVLPDVGIAVAQLGEGWLRAVEGLNAALGQADLTAFLQAFQELGRLLAKAHPRGRSPVEELPDELPEERAS